MDVFLLIVVGFPVLLYSAILHEIAHGYVADRLGDPTARLMGRLTLNPLPHLDLYMSVVLPLVLLLSGSPIVFGGAKPVIIDPFNFKEGKKDIALAALAGPATNLLLAVAASVVFHALSPIAGSQGIQIIQLILRVIVNINISLAVINLLPIPGVDGATIFAFLLPDREAQAFLRLGGIGFIILLLLLFFPIGGFSLMNFMQNIFTIISHFLGF